jgi:hypothetical protein
MKLLLLVPIGMWMMSSVRGGPVERAIVAAMRLSEQPSYGWATVVTDDARTYDIEGRAQKGGYTWVRLPAIKAITSRLGRDSEGEIEAVFNGATTAVVRTATGWKTLGELPRASRDWEEDYVWSAPPPPMPMPMGAGLGGMGRGGFGAVDPLDVPIVMPMPALARDPEARKPYSNVQFTASCPHDELAVIVSSYTDLKMEGDVAIGTLSDVGARLLLVHDGQEEKIKPLAAAGTFRLHIKDGLVTKYVVQLEGLVLVDKKKVHVHQSSSTTIKDVGKAGFEVTEEIRRKLGG